MQTKEIIKKLFVALGNKDVSTVKEMVEELRKNSETDHSVASLLRSTTNADGATIFQLVDAFCDGNMDRYSMILALKNLAEIGPNHNLESAVFKAKRRKITNEAQQQNSASVLSVDHGAGASSAIRFFRMQATPQLASSAMPAQKSVPTKHEQEELRPRDLESLFSSCMLSRSIPASPVQGIPKPGISIVERPKSYFSFCMPSIQRTTSRFPFRFPLAKRALSSAKPVSGSMPDVAKEMKENNGSNYSGAQLVMRFRALIDEETAAARMLLSMRQGVRVIAEDEISSTPPGLTMNISGTSHL